MRATIFVALLFLSVLTALTGCTGVNLSPPTTTNSSSASSSSSGSNANSVTIGFSTSTIQSGEPATLLWSAPWASSCSASGAWSETQGTSGQANVTQTFPGTYAYNLTCTGAGGSATGSAMLVVNPHILVDASTIGPLITRDEFGANMAVYGDISNPTGQAALLQNLGVNLIRWPGGTESDQYHWQTNSFSGNTAPCGPSFQPPAADTFDNLEHTLVASGNFDVAITVNYGTNAQCNGPADPNEAAQWVAYAKQQNYGVHYWTVGNEVYGNWEPDLHSPGANDAATYAQNVATQFYPLMKAQDASAQIGVVVNAAGGAGGAVGWDPIVLSQAKYDFVELHYYPELAGMESDTTLLTQAPEGFANEIATIQRELAVAGHPNTPIYLSEYNSVNTTPGKQSVSIVSGLYVGMMQGEILKAGLPLASIWAGVGANCTIGGNTSSTLYGWQTFGNYGLFPLDTVLPACPSNEGVTPTTPFPNARAYALSSAFGTPGNHMLNAAVSTAVPLVRAYAAQHGSGYALMLFNLDPTNTVTITVGITHAPNPSYNGTMTTYDKSIYDQSESGTWAPAATQPMGSLTFPVIVTLQPWSMNVVTLQ